MAELNASPISHIISQTQHHANQIDERTHKLSRILSET